MQSNILWGEMPSKSGRKNSSIYLCRRVFKNSLSSLLATLSVEGILDFDLWANNLQSLGYIELAKLFCGSEHNQLSSFTVHFNPITDEGVHHLVTELTHTNCKLTDLSLIDNKITDEGVKHLTVALTHTNCKLNSLSLEKNQITDEGAKQLTSALTHSNCKLTFLIPQ